LDLTPFLYAYVWWRSALIKNSAWLFCKIGVLDGTCLNSWLHLIKTDGTVLDEGIKQGGSWCLQHRGSRLRWRLIHIFNGIIGQGATRVHCASFAISGFCAKVVSYHSCPWWTGACAAGFKDCQTIKARFTCLQLATSRTCWARVLTSPFCWA